MRFSPGQGVWDCRQSPRQLRRIVSDVGRSHVVLKGPGPEETERVSRLHLRPVRTAKAKPRERCTMGLQCEVHRNPLHGLGVG